MKSRLVIAVCVVFALTLAIAGNASADVNFTFVNNTNQTIWVGSLGNSGKVAPNNGGWQLAPGATSQLTVPDDWGGRFWGRTGCRIDADGKFRCDTGDCGGRQACAGIGGKTPATLAEFTLNGWGGRDFYDVSFVDGFNLPMSIQTSGGLPNPSDPYACAEAGCGVDLNTNCPPELQQRNSAGQIVGCRSACETFGTDQYCCRGINYGTPDKCKPEQWPVNYAAYFKSACPRAYSYAYDDPSSTYTCADCGYKIIFGKTDSSPPPPPPPPVTVAPPTNLSTTATTSNSASLSWRAPTNATNVKSYDVLRNGVKVGNTTQTTFTDTNLQSSTTYSYTVKAVDGSGNSSVASNSVSAVTAAPIAVPGNCGGPNLFLRSGGGLCSTAGTTTGTVVIPSANGINNDGRPTNAVTFTSTGITRTYKGTATGFTFFVDSGTAVANGVQAEVSYDFTGNGSWDRVETYRYFATNNLNGWEQYTQARGLKSATGNYANLVNGKVQVKLWSAIGKASSTVRVENQSLLATPFQ